MVPEWLLLWAVQPQLVRAIATSYDLDDRLVMAMVQQESSGGRRLTRHEPKFRWVVTPRQFARQLGISWPTELVHQMTSWGPLHVMGGTARDLGYTDELPNLIYPEIGLRFGCMYLRQKLTEHDGDVTKALAAYNAGSVRYRFGKLIPKSRAYVDAVMRYYRELQGP